MKQITPEEAIKAIKSNYPPESYTILREALDLAIEKLEEASGIKADDVRKAWDNVGIVTLPNTMPLIVEGEKCKPIPRTSTWEKKGPSNLTASYGGIDPRLDKE